MRIFDCFIFHDEWDILEIRLRELYDVVDKFVIVTGRFTFQGAHVNERWTAEQVDRFRPWMDKIYVYDEFNNGRNFTPWDRERSQRNGIAVALKDLGAEGHDVIIISDADEIPRAESLISMVRFVDEPMFMGLPAFYSAIDVRSSHEHTIRVLKYRDLTTPQEIREKMPKRGLWDAGWHFSYLGNIEQMQKKMRSYAHKEFNKPRNLNTKAMQDRIRNLEPVWGGHKEKFEVVPINHRWPRAIKEDRDRWRKYEWKQLVSSFQ
jgi:hypothetical protein